jgi:hypothetical protein
LFKKIVLESVALEDSSFTGDAYTSLAIMYGTFSLANWFAPSAITILTPKWAMVIGAASYVQVLTAQSAIT